MLVLSSKQRSLVATSVHKQTRMKNQTNDLMTFPFLSRNHFITVPHHLSEFWLQTSPPSPVEKNQSWLLQKCIQHQAEEDDCDCLDHFTEDWQCYPKIYSWMNIKDWEGRWKDWKANRPKAKSPGRWEGILSTDLWAAREDDLAPD